MTVDFRANMSTSIGVCRSGDLSSNHISDRSGLVMTQGRLMMEGIVNPARGTSIDLVVTTRQLGIVTRFPKRLWVVRSVVNTTDRVSEVEVGCRLTLMKNRRDKIQYFADTLLGPPADPITDPFIPPSGNTARPVVPVFAQKLLEFCLESIGITLAASSRPLEFRYLVPSIDLSAGYVQTIGDLVRSEGCFGRMLPDDTFEVVQLELGLGQEGPILQDGDFFSLEAITAGADPPDRYIVTYEATERAAS